MTTNLPQHSSEPPLSRSPERRNENRKLFRCMRLFLVGRENQILCTQPTQPLESAFWQEQTIHSEGIADLIDVSPDHMRPSSRPQVSNKHTHVQGRHKTPIRSIRRGDKAKRWDCLEMSLRIFWAMLGAILTWLSLQYWDKSQASW